MIEVLIGTVGLPLLKLLGVVFSYVVLLRFVADFLLYDLKLTSLFIHNKLFSCENHPLIGFYRLAT